MKRAMFDLAVEMNLTLNIATTKISWICEKIPQLEEGELAEAVRVAAFYKDAEHDEQVTIINDRINALKAEKAEHIETLNLLRAKAEEIGIADMIVEENYYSEYTTDYCPFP